MAAANSSDLFFVKEFVSWIFKGAKNGDCIVCGIYTEEADDSEFKMKIQDGGYNY